MAVGRVGNNQLVRKILFNIQTQLSKQQDLFEKISSNKEILRPSSDPFGANKAMASRDHLSRNEEYSDIIDISEIWMNLSSEVLDNAVEAWKRVNEVAIQSADGTKTAADRIAMAEELEQLLEHMIQVANTTNGNRFIFSGSKTDTPPFATERDANTGRVTGVFYKGDTFEREVKSKDDGLTPINIVGSNAGNPEVKGAFVDSNEGTDVFKIMIDLRDKLLNNDTIGISGTGGILSKIDQAAENLTATQVQLGGAQERFDFDRTRIIQQQSEIKTFLSEVEDADIAELILELNNVQNVYEAALASGGRLVQSGLINYI